MRFTKGKMPFIKIKIRFLGIDKNYFLLLIPLAISVFIVKHQYFVC